MNEQLSDSKSDYQKFCETCNEPHPHQVIADFRYETDGLKLNCLFTRCYQCGNLVKQFPFGVMSVRGADSLIDHER